MRESNKKDRLLAGAVVFGLAIGALATPAAAQSPTPPAEPKRNTDTTKTEAAEEIVVTGSRIRRSSFDNPVPVASISGEAIRQGGAAQLAELVTSSPQFQVASNNQANAGTIFNGGQSRLDLRGLGTNRTLVLVDGRRHVTGEFRGSAVDTNMIPIQMVDRVDVVSGGASAVYGSEAISGVVNIVLRKDLEGLQTDFQIGSTEEGDGEEWVASGAWGLRFANDKGYFIFGAEAAAVEPILRRDRDWALQGVRRDPNVGSIAAGGVVGQPIVPGTKTLLSNRGTWLFSGGTTSAAPIPRPGDPDPNRGSTNNIVTPGVAVNVTRTGQVVQLSPECATVTTGTAFVRATCVDPVLEFGGIYDSLQGYVNRQNLRAYSEFEFLPNSKIFGEVSYSRVRAYQMFQPGFSSQTVAGQATNINAEVRGDNAFLAGPGPTAAALRAAWTASGRTFTQPSRVTINKFYDEIGLRASNQERETVRAVFGIQGEFDLFGRKATYDGYAQFGRLTGTTTQPGQVITARINNAIDAVVGNDGTIACRSERAIPQAQRTCVPYDLINGPSQAAIDYVRATGSFEGEALQDVGAANFSYEVFELPAGPIVASVGIEARKESGEQIQDALGASGQLNTNAIGRTAGEYDIVEYAGELVVPLLRDFPGAHRLQVEGAWRVGNYSTVGLVDMHRYAAEWAPLKDVRFRGSQAMSVRAPNITELFAPQSDNFTTAQSDPCDRAESSRGPNPAIRQRNCASVIDGYNPATFISNFGPARSSLRLLQGGNPNLDKESAETITYGLVVQPRFIPGFTASWDFWNVIIEDAVGTIPLAQLLGPLCYDAAVLPANNPQCALIDRNRSTGAVNVIQLTNVNVATLKTRGFDVSAQYRFDLNDALGLIGMKPGGDFGQISLRGDWTRVQSYTNQGLPRVTPTQSAGVAGTPQNKAIGTITWTNDRMALSWQTQWQDEAGVGDNIAFPDPRVRDPFYTENYFTHDVRGFFDINERFTVRAGVVNLTNELPPNLPETFLGSGAASSTFDNRGRYGYVGINAKF